MGTKTRYALLLSVLVLISIVFSACAPQAAPAEAETTTWPDWATASCNRGDQTVVIDQKTVDCAEVLGGKAPNNIQAPAPKPVETGKNGSETDTLTLTMGEDFPAPACAEQMMGPYQPPSTHAYWYVQVNTEFEDSDYLVSLFYEKDITLSGWMVQEGGPDKNGNDPQITEIVYTVRTSIDEVQFANPAGGVSWRLCAHPDAQLGAEVQQHAENIAEARSWLRVYNVGDLWMSLATGDAELKKLIKCIDPVIAGIPSCQNP